MTVNEVDALILDFGSVISKSMFETHRETEAALNLPSGSLTWMGPFDPDKDLLWNRLQTGEISQRDYWQQRAQEVGKLVGQDWTNMVDLLKAARGDNPMPVMRPEVLALIEDAHAQGKRLGILSNELDLFYGADIRAKLPFLDRFDVIVDATYTGVLKPDPKAYHLCLDELNLPASRCLFIDDHQPNVDAARDIGLGALFMDIRDPTHCVNQARAQLRLIHSAR